MGAVRIISSRWFGLVIAAFVVVALFAKIDAAEARKGSTTPSWADVTLDCAADTQGEITLTILNPSERTLYINGEIFIYMQTVGLAGGERAWAAWMLLIPDALELSPGDREPFSFPLALLGVPDLSGVGLIVYVEVGFNGRPAPLSARFTFAGC